MSTPSKRWASTTLELRLHSDVTATLKLRVESTTPEVLPVAPAPKPAEGKEAKEGAARTESRGHKRAERVRDESAAPEAAEKGHRPERKPHTDKTDKTPKAPKADKADKPPKADKAEKPVKPAKAEKAEKAE